MLVVLAAFVLWLAMRGELGVYAGFLTRTASASTGALPSTSPGTSGGSATSDNPDSYMTGGLFVPGSPMQRYLDSLMGDSGWRGGRWF